MTASHEAPQFTLPNLRVDVDGVWYDDEVEITHPGIVANLRGNLRRDGEGYFIQTRVRIPVIVDDVPWVVTRVGAGRRRSSCWPSASTTSGRDAAPSGSGIENTS